LELALIDKNAEKNPWTTLSSREVYRNNWITVREDQVLRPDGLPGIYGVVQARLAVGVVALTRDQKVVMVGQYRYPVDQYSWEIVEGGAEDGDTALMTAQRELREEAGYEAEMWTPLGSEIHLSNSFSAERAVLFVAQNLRPVPAAPEPTEQLQVRQVVLADALGMIDSGEITDAFTIMGLMLWHRQQLKLGAAL
jgi:8-oxo-dGTP pyrophosphatase MutT (NUDIX family)